MWAMTSFGILMPAIRPPHTVAAGDDRTMQIRARRAKDLDILRAKYMPATLGPTRPTPDKDYEYRAYCTPHAFALAMAAMVVEIDYLKFKPTTEARYSDGELHECYNAIWSVVLGRLSSKLHQWEYRHARRPATGWAPLPASADTVTRTGTGWAYGAPWRNTGADRDAYEPDPALDELTALADTVTRTDRDDIDALYDEIDRILPDTERLDHRHCAHAASDNARARCRRRRRRAAAERIEALQARIDDLYREPLGLDPAPHIVELPAEPAVTGEVVGPGK